MFRMKRAQTLHVAGNQCGGRILGKLGNGELFRMIANCRPGIENPGSLRLGVIEQMRRIDVFHVEWRIFAHDRSEEHTSELQSIMRISYAVFCLNKKHRSS